MAKQVITYGRLIAIDQEFAALETNNPGLTILLESKIKAFYACNGTIVTSAKNKMKELFEKYVMRDGNGGYQTTGEGGEYRFYTPQHKKEFNEEFENYCSQTFEMIL